MINSTTGSHLVGYFYKIFKIRDIYSTGLYN